MTSAASQKHSIRYGDRRIEFELIPSPRRTAEIRIVVDPMTGVRVFAPGSAKMADVRAAVRRRARWIHQRTEDANANPLRNRFVSGEQALYLGKRYMLKVESARTTAVKLRHGILHVELPDRSASCVADALSSWYRANAKRYFQKRLTELYSPTLDGGQQPPPFRIQSMTRQWGSCSPSGKLLLNPSLIKAPRECIDYVLVHELCHLRHHDHSPAFKRLLTRRMPDWESRKAALERAALDVLR